MKRKILLIAILILAILGIVLTIYRDNTSQNALVTPRQKDTAAAEPEPPAFDKTRHSLSEPTNLWLVVNKKRPLTPQTYTPPDLVTPDVPLRVPGNESMQMRASAAEALISMFAEAKSGNVPMMVSSGYRSYGFQSTLYNKYVRDQGQAAADAQSARPGYSEHQTGLSVDVEPLDKSCEVERCFADTGAGKWVAANAYMYGFIIRYPEGKIGITGYEYEPWHLRYVGVELAAAMREQRVQTLEEFFGLPAAANY